jgi:hypothetical protein
MGTALSAPLSVSGLLGFSSVDLSVLVFMVYTGVRGGAIGVPAAIGLLDNST